MPATSPREPYPPDLPDDPAELDVDDEPRLELRGGVVRRDLAGLRGAERLAGVQMAWDDVLANAPVFAAALGIVVVD